MKIPVKALSILCGGLLIISPLNGTSFAEDFNNRHKVKEEKVQEHIIKEEQTNNIQCLNTKAEEPTVKVEKVENNKEISQELDKDIEKAENKEVAKDPIQKVEKETIVKEESTQPQEIIKQEENKSTVEIIDTLNLEQAKELLTMRNPGIEQVYQGDENTFESLKEKNLSGYVFLPDVEGDLGYFVDKNTANIYYFHPSGYLDLIV